MFVLSLTPNMGRVSFHAAAQFNSLVSRSVVAESLRGDVRES